MNTLEYRVLVLTLVNSANLINYESNQIVNMTLQLFPKYQIRSSSKSYQSQSDGKNSVVLKTKPAKMTSNIRQKKFKTKVMSTMESKNLQQSKRGTLIDGDEQNLDSLENQIKHKIKAGLYNSYKNDPFVNEDFIISDSYVQFSRKRFIKFFIYHLLYYFYFGPLIYFILLPFENKNFLLNMGFMGFGLGARYQMLQWFPLLIASVIFYSGIDHEYITLTEIAMAYLTIVLRCLIVSIRYATTLQSRIDMQYKRIFTDQENQQEYLGTGWRDIHPLYLDQEIKHSMIRNEVENFFFNFKFIIKINEEYKERFNNYNYYIDHKYEGEKQKIYLLKFYEAVLFGQQNQSVKRKFLSETIDYIPHSIIDIHNSYHEEPTKEDLFMLYSGRQVVKEFILASKHLSQFLHKRVFTSIGYIHAVLPFIINLFLDLHFDQLPQQQLQIKYKSACFWIYTIMLVVVNSVTYSVNQEFLRIGMIDMKRRLFLMRICEYILEPNKHKVKGVFKVFPLINYFDPQTLLSWMDMRQMLLDVGKRFHIRIELYIQMYLIVYILIAAVYLLYFFQIFNFYMEKAMVAILIFEIVNQFVVLYMNFYYGALINEISNNQLLRICELRNVLERLKVDWEKIVCCSRNNAVMMNNTFRLSLLYFDFVSKDQGPERCKEILMESTAVLEVVSFRLEKELQLNPITILGVPLNTTVLKAIQTSVISLIAAMINKKTQLLN
ncbi:UNKNOWN [Stylonychia lemnae]|uniref:Transmembrane protein n=1 Tax=Stylonychia lemnae TaxID=5949 RepID=A0A078AKE2_STYLE|nr:UNKNOWN [Stylonychia lemnae]|eukprot:CDW82679.1 UNKNOWN [Stylonychia lemnae]